MLFLVRFGWAKPVIVNPSNFRQPKRDDILVSVAGPAMNLVLGFIAFYAILFIRSHNLDVSPITYGIIQMIFNYGTIRLSTEGEETTYIFHFVANPKHQIGIVNNAIEAFKNGRPVDD